MKGLKSDISVNAATSIESIKGVGPKTAAAFRAAGIAVVGDLLSYLPRRHEDYSTIVAIDAITPGKQTIAGSVESISTKNVRRGMSVTTAVIADASGKLNAVWFNQPYRAAQFANGGTFMFSGTFEFRYNRYQLTNPTVEQAATAEPTKGRVVPIYPQTKDLKTATLEKIMTQVRPLIRTLQDPLPQELVERESLMSYAEALDAMHFPSDPESVQRARERLGFDELFSLLLASNLNKQQMTALRGQPIVHDIQHIKQFVSSLPFQLTDDQRVAAWEIIQDIGRDVPMNRMVQGDVGSGKTVVAAIAALAASKAGFQTAFMAPTEVLAIQHAKTLAAILEPFDVEVALLTGSVSKKNREPMLQAIANGTVSIIVGTHALIQDTVTYHELGLVVIDEQHRFGVAQRQKLLSKAGVMPHLLSMTATPIPRSLQLTIFGEMDVSILKQKPAIRKPIISKLVSPISASSIYADIDALISEGRQAYVICGLITESATTDKKSVETEYKKLKNSVFGHRRIAMLHGKMKPQEKDQIMNDFKAHAYDILISTTVVEVGVDVPNAAAIMIENADTFGLSQLHQLRGRVGRGEHQSYCYFMLSDTKKPSQRLRELEKSEDGFYLSEVDLKLRGPGEIYGKAQHGELRLDIANIADVAAVKRADAAAKWFIKSGNDLLQYTQLHQAVERYQRLTRLN